jgi:hypothetical protein
MPEYPSNITIHVNTNNTNHFSPEHSYVAPSGQVTLKSTGNSAANVCTYQNGSLTPVFTSGSPPYAATTGSGTQYTLLSTISGQITIQTTTSSTCSSTPSSGDDRDHVRGGRNGTINVGG